MLESLLLNKVEREKIADQVKVFVYQNCQIQLHNYFAHLIPKR